MQPIYNKMYTISLGGMNYGDVYLDDGSGEVFFLNYISAKEEGVLIIDVGANVGNYTFQCERIFGEKAGIHLFEPSATAFNQAENNLREYTNIIFNNEGLGARQEQGVALNCQNYGGCGSSLVKRDFPGSEFKYDKIETVALNTLENYCKTKGIKEITLLKIDVEGYELEVLKGGGEFITKAKVKYIQFEFGDSAIGAGIHFKDLYEVLAEKYSIYRLLRNGFEHYDIYNVCMEVYIAANYIAIRKDLILPRGNII